MARGHSRISIDIDGHSHLFRPQGFHHLFDQFGFAKGGAADGYFISFWLQHPIGGAQIRDASAYGQRHGGDRRHTRNHIEHRVPSFDDHGPHSGDGPLMADRLGPERPPPALWVHSQLRIKGTDRPTAVGIDDQAFGPGPAAVPAGGDHHIIVVVLIRSASGIPSDPQPSLGADGQTRNALKFPANAM